MTNYKYEYEIGDWVYVTHPSDTKNPLVKIKREILDMANFPIEGGEVYLFTVLMWEGWWEEGGLEDGYEFVIAENVHRTIEDAESWLVDFWDWDLEELEE